MCCEHKEVQARSDRAAEAACVSISVCHASPSAALAARMTGSLPAVRGKLLEMDLCLNKARKPVVWWGRRGVGVCRGELPGAVAHGCDVFPSSAELLRSICHIKLNQRRQREFTVFYSHSAELREKLQSEGKQTPQTAKELNQIYLLCHILKLCTGETIIII